MHPPLVSVSVAGRLTFHIFRTFMCIIASEIDCEVCISIQLMGAFSLNPTAGFALDQTEGAAPIHLSPTHPH